MTVPQMILGALKDVLLAFTPNRSLQEALLKYDFKVGVPRQNLMQLCFSPLANLPLVILLTILWLDPVNQSIPLESWMSQIFGAEGDFRYLLLDGRISVMAAFSVVFFFLEFIFKLEYLWVVILFFFLAKWQLHIHLAVSGLIGIYLARAIYLCFLQSSLVSQTKKIWCWGTGLQLIATVAAAIISLVVVDGYERNRILETFRIDRTDFFFLLILFFSFCQFLALTCWGHFHFQKQTDPTFLPVYFSSSTWLPRMKPRPRLQARLREKVAASLHAHTKSIKDLNEMKDQGLGVRLDSLEKVLNQELVYLQTAASRLTSS
jgi:hypothetical protein